MLSFTKISKVFGVLASPGKNLASLFKILASPRDAPETSHSGVLKKPRKTKDFKKLDGIYRYF